MPTADGYDQYAGLSHGQSYGYKYAKAKRVKRGGYTVRLLMPNEIREFKERMQRIIDGAEKRKAIPLDHA